jgi:hypothetical protein
MIPAWSMIFSENRCPLFGIMIPGWSMIFSENRCPLFGIMLWRRNWPIAENAKEPAFQRALFMF